MYDRLLSQGRPAPVPEEGADWVKVTIQRRIVRPAVLRLLADADERFQLTQRERIVLGALAQTEGMTAKELGAVLETEYKEDLRVWLGRLQAFGLVGFAGRTRAIRYFVEPALLSSADLRLPTTLLRIEPYRLRALILEDLSRYPDSSRVDINKRVGTEISAKNIKRSLDDLSDAGEIAFSGERRWRRYRLSDHESKGQKAR